MEADAHGEVCCIGAQEDFLPLGDRVHYVTTVVGKAYRDGDADSLDLEDSFLELQI
jgi:hypothetical protein